MLNLVGTPCPMNFVEIKTALERAEPGASLDALVDGGPVGADLADSLKINGFDILSIAERGASLLLTVRKRQIVSVRISPRRKETPCHKSARRKRR